MTEIKSLLRTLGVTAHLYGFNYLVRATELVMENSDCLLHIVKMVYTVIAEEFQTSSKCVERNIRTAIDICWIHGNRDLLCEIAGYELKQKPTNSQFIDIISAYLSRNRVRAV
ncbi:MAG: sporulation initiation factor Spo0A C-terminal domain-containing protein [Bacillota bacterium]|nr:sporulation initiation factor Spo0A C-terminal domain-containing protein [Bacillota bacterium]